VNGKKLLSIRYWRQGQPGLIFVEQVQGPNLEAPERGSTWAGSGFPQDFIRVKKFAVDKHSSLFGLYIN
jgi:hypothetical protein